MALAEDVHRAIEEAFYAEAMGDLQRAHDQYSLAYGARKAGGKEMERESFRLTLDDLQTKLDELRRRISQAAGYGKLRRFPITHALPSESA